MPEVKTTRWRVTALPWRTALDTLATVTFIAVAGTFLWFMASGRLAPAPAVPVAQAAAPPTRRAEPPLPSQPVSIKDAPLEGDPAAKVALIEYSDFQCPFCGKFARDVLPEIRKTYLDSGRALMAFRHLPLAIHSLAQKAGEAGECAARQGRFWPMHDWLFRETPKLEESRLREGARELALDTRAFDACLNGQAALRVQEDAASARPLGITGTPSFLVGLVQSDGRVRVVKRLTGAQPFEQFKAVIDAVAAQAAPR